MAREKQQESRPNKRTKSRQTETFEANVNEHRKLDGTRDKEQTGASSEGKTKAK